jgi:hypothetical protein
MGLADTVVTMRQLGIVGTPLASAAVALAVLAEETPPLHDIPAPAPPPVATAVTEVGPDPESDET